MVLIVAKTDVQLRDYRQECLDAIVASTDHGVKRMVVALPTGTSKTVIFAQLPRVLRAVLKSTKKRRANRKAVK